VVDPRDLGTPEADCRYDPSWRRTHRRAHREIVRIRKEWRPRLPKARAVSPWPETHLSLPPVVAPSVYCEFHRPGRPRDERVSSFSRRREKFFTSFLLVRHRGGRPPGRNCRNSAVSDLRGGSFSLERRDEEQSPGPGIVSSLRFLAMKVGRRFQSGRCRGPGEGCVRAQPWRHRSDIEVGSRPARLVKCRF